MVSRAGRILGISVLSAGLISGCGGMEENPLNVNGVPQPEQNAAPVQDPEGGTVEQDLGDDPLNLGINGAKLCSVQPAAGFQEYTVLIHNETLETFTLDDVRLGSASGLTLNKAEVTHANRGGHGNHSMADGSVMSDDDIGNAGGAAGEHGGHDPGAVSTDTEEPKNVFFSEPVPAEGYEISTLEYANVVVAVAIEEGADNGTSKSVEIEYSTADGSFTGAHPLEITMDRASCA